MSRADALLEIDGAVSSARRRMTQLVTTAVVQGQSVPQADIAVMFLDEVTADLAEHVEDVLAVLFEQRSSGDDDDEDDDGLHRRTIMAHIAIDNAAQLLWEAIDAFLKAEHAPSVNRMSGVLRRIFRGLREELAAIVEGLPSSDSCCTEDESGVILPLLRRRRGDGGRNREGPY